MAIAYEACSIRSFSYEDPFARQLAHNIAAQRSLQYNTFSPRLAAASLSLPLNFQVSASLPSVLGAALSVPWLPEAAHPSVTASAISAARSSPHGSLRQKGPRR